MAKKPAIRPLRATYNPDAPYVVERHEDEEGGIQYEIIDKRPDTYRRLCTISDEFSVTRAQAKRDADMIVCALNAKHRDEGLLTALASIPENVYWLLAKGRLRPEEPLYAIQLLRPGTEYVIAEAEGDSIQECVAEALSRSKAKGG